MAAAVSPTEDDEAPAAPESSTGQAPRPRSQGGFLISKVHHVSQRALARRLRERGIDQINAGQGRVLFALWQGDRITLTELAERTALEKSTLTRMIDRLEADQMVRRELPPADRRTVKVVLTERTRSMLGAFAEVSDQLSEQYYRGFTAQEVAAFEGMLERILTNVTADRGPDS